MVSARDLLDALREAGRVLRPSPGGRLLATRAAWGLGGLKLTPDQLERVRAAKLEILGLLAEEARDALHAVRRRVNGLPIGRARAEAESLLGELAIAVDGFIRGDDTAATMAVLGWRIGLVTKPQQGALSPSSSAERRPS